MENDEIDEGNAQRKYNRTLKLKKCKRTCKTYHPFFKYLDTMHEQ